MRLEFFSGLKNVFEKRHFRDGLMLRDRQYNSNKAALLNCSGVCSVNRATLDKDCVFSVFTRRRTKLC